MENGKPPLSQVHEESAIMALYWTGRWLKRALCSTVNAVSASDYYQVTRHKSICPGAEMENWGDFADFSACRSQA